MEQKEGENFDEGRWVVQVESGLEREDIPGESHDGLIHTVPKSLLTKNPEFYHPQVISFGPYHFKIKDPEKNDMERLKSEVARKMHLKIINKGGLKSVMEKFKEKEAQKKIKESYAKNFELSIEACAWMIVRDACFVLEVLDRFREDEDKEKNVKASMDGTLSRKRHHPLLTEIVKDMLKMENQLPFWALEKIRLEIVGSDDDYRFESALNSNGYVWFESALKKLSPIEVAKRRDRKYKKESHILQLLHDYIVDKQAPSDNQSGKSWIYGIKSILPMILKFMVLDRSLCSPKTFMKLLFRSLRWLLLSPIIVILFIWRIIFSILYYIKNYIFAILYCIWSCISPTGEEMQEDEVGEHVPTVEELQKAGVKFKKLEGDKRGISHIKFVESDSTLYLPKLKVDNRSEVILRNLIALEICSQEEEKPITRYAILMNDLINTSVDVGILRRKGIITSKLGSDDEVAELWNSMVTSTEMPRYHSIDIAASSINGYRKKWWEVLWAQFVMVHCSKPWLFISLFAGFVLLMLTLTQVVCIFESCQLK